MTTARRRRPQLSLPGMDPVEITNPAPRRAYAHERALQRELIRWADDMVKLGVADELRWLHAIPNGGKRPGREAALMVAEGVRAGVHDLFLPVARHGFHGLYLEMKHGRNTLSDLQCAFAAFVLEQGYCMEVCWSVREAQDVLLWYLDIERSKRVLGLF